MNDKESKSPLNDPDFTTYVLGEETETSVQEWNALVEKVPELAAEHFAVGRIAGALRATLHTETVSQGLAFTRRREIFEELSRHKRARRVSKLSIPIAVAASVAVLCVAGVLLNRPTSSGLATGPQEDPPVLRVNLVTDVPVAGHEAIFVRGEHALVVPQVGTLHPNSFIDPRLPLFSAPATQVGLNGFPTLDPEPAVGTGAWFDDKGHEPEVLSPL